MPTYFATCARGLEPILADELRALNARDVEPGRGGVHFSGEQDLLYRANLWLRTAVRVLQPIYEAKVDSTDDLYAAIMTVDWSQYLTPDHTLAVDCNVRDSKITHSQYAARRVKDAICDQFVARVGRRPSVDVERPMLGLNLHVYRDHAILSFDSSWDSLHKRGYRPHLTKAPLNEALAAGLIQSTGWNGNAPFVDPMCGSAAFPIEAAWIALKRPPGLTRKHFGFMGWMDFDKGMWAAIRDEARDGVLKKLPAFIGGSDIRPDAVEFAKTNSKAAGIGHLLSFERKDLREFRPPDGPPGVLMCNPPYGERIGEDRELRPLYRTMGETFLERCRGWTCFVFTSVEAPWREIGMKPKAAVPFWNGKIACKLFRYEPGDLMFWFLHDGDPDWILLGSIASLLLGAVCGGGVLAAGLMRGHQTLAWTGFGVCLFVGLGCFLVVLLPAGAFLGIMFLTEPVERGRRRPIRPSRAYADRDYLPAIDTRPARQRSDDRGPPPKPPPAAILDEAPEIVDELPLESEASRPVPAVHPVLAEIRAKLGPSPRWFPQDVLNALSLRRPAWVESDELEIVLRDQRAVLAMGEVFWGALVQANAALLRPGPLDHPANLVYSRDPAVVRDPARLVAIAKKLHDLKNTHPESPSLRKIANLLGDERRRALRWEVPESLTGGMAVYFTTVLVGRTLLPGRMLVGPIVPVLVRYDTPATLVVPSAMWPRGFRVDWEEQAKKVTEARPWLTIMPAAAAYLKRRAAAENVAAPWCFRLWIERDVDGSNARIQTAFRTLDADPVLDQRLQGGGITVVIRKAHADEFRGVEIDVVGERLVIV